MREFDYDAKLDDKPNLFLEFKIKPDLYFTFKITNFFGQDDERRYIISGIDYSPVDKVGEAMKCSVQTHAERSIKAIHASEIKQLNAIDEIMDDVTIYLKPVC